MQVWMEKGLLKLNMKKFKVVPYSHQIDFKNDYYLQSDGLISVLEHLDYIKDLGVTFYFELKFDQHNY